MRKVILILSFFFVCGCQQSTTANIRWGQESDVLKIGYLYDENYQLLKDRIEEEMDERGYGERNAENHTFICNEDCNDEMEALAEDYVDLIVGVGDAATASVQAALNPNHIPTVLAFGEAGQFQSELDCEPMRLFFEEMMSEVSKTFLVQEDLYTAWQAEMEAAQNELNEIRILEEDLALQKESIENEVIFVLETENEGLERELLLSIIDENNERIPLISYQLDLDEVARRIAEKASAGLKGIESEDNWIITQTMVLHQTGLDYLQLDPTNDLLPYVQ